MKDQTVFSTPWFTIVEKYCLNISNEPFYSFHTLDYVSILAVTDQKEILLVKQYRPVVDNFTLELPGGHVEKNQTPEQAAQNELFEETGYLTKKLDFLGDLNPDVGRMANKLWCYYTGDISIAKKRESEKGIEVVKYPIQQISELIKNKQFNHALNLATLFLADLKDVFKKL